MKYFEYKLYYMNGEEVMENIRYTLAEDDRHALNNFECIAPQMEGKQWLGVERYCPYANKWIRVNINNKQPMTNGQITGIT